jgi:NAD-dependent SIR2 family protein deacetylase
MNAGSAPLDSSGRQAENGYDESDLTALADLVSDGEVAILTGAGISTESGIPDYRGPTGRARPASPMTYQEFVSSEAARQRYWARSFVGWRRIAQARPNPGHRAVGALQHAGLVSGLITQNVDGLHQAAGSDNIIELHGSLSRVVCLHCGNLSDRAGLERRFEEANPGWSAHVSAGGVVKPDGDIDIDAADTARFRTVECLICGVGPLKPDVVFFGENVPADRVAGCYQLVRGSRALLVLGSSLTVASGFRFARRAVTENVPLAIVNSGPTRADALATLRLDTQLGSTLSALVSRLDITDGHSPTGPHEWTRQ